jgi:hypothetical protein
MARPLQFCKPLASAIDDPQSAATPASLRIRIPRWMPTMRNTRPRAMNDGPKIDGRNRLRTGDRPRTICRSCSVPGFVVMTSDRSLLNKTGIRQAEAAWCRWTAALASPVGLAIMTAWACPRWDDGRSESPVRISRAHYGLSGPLRTQLTHALRANYPVLNREAMAGRNPVSSGLGPSNAVKSAPGRSYVIIGADRWIIPRSFRCLQHGWITSRMQADRPGVLATTPGHPNTN